MRAVKFLQLSSFGRNRSSFDIFLCSCRTVVKSQLLLKFDNPQNLQSRRGFRSSLRICSSLKFAAAARFAARLNFDNGGAAQCRCRFDTQGWREIFINVCERPGNHMIRPPSSYARAIIVPNKKEESLSLLFILSLIDFIIQ